MSYAHQEMPDDIYAQFADNVGRFIDEQRTLFRTASVGGEFGIKGLAKGSKARRTTSVTKGESLRGTKGTKGGEFQRRQGKGRPRGKRPALPEVKDIGTLDDITNLHTL